LAFPSCLCAFVANPPAPSDSGLPLVAGMTACAPGLPRRIESITQRQAAGAKAAASRRTPRFRVRGPLQQKPRNDAGGDRAPPLRKIAWPLRPWCLCALVVSVFIFSTNGERRTRMDSRVRLPSSVCRLPSYVSLRALRGENLSSLISMISLLELRMMDDR
jgi:hypothetical protein